MSDNFYDCLNDSNFLLDDFDENAIFAMFNDVKEEEDDGANNDDVDFLKPPKETFDKVVIESPQLPDAVKTTFNCPKGSPLAEMLNCEKPSPSPPSLPQQPLQQQAPPPPLQHQQQQQYQVVYSANQYYHPSYPQQMTPNIRYVYYSQPQMQHPNYVYYQQNPQPSQHMNIAQYYQTVSPQMSGHMQRPVYFQQQQPTYLQPQYQHQQQPRYVYLSSTPSSYQPPPFHQPQPRAISPDSMLPNAKGEEYQPKYVYVSSAPSSFQPPPVSPQVRPSPPSNSMLPNTNAQENVMKILESHASLSKMPVLVPKKGGRAARPKPYKPASSTYQRKKKPAVELPAEPTLCQKDA